MDSRRQNRSKLFAPLNPTSSVKAAFSLKNGLARLYPNSSAGMNAGVFFDCGYRVVGTVA
jgi:hypothetical protein